jgi:eukaryotic-like serine/threonine-protein kinase
MRPARPTSGASPSDDETNAGLLRGGRAALEDRLDEIEGHEERDDRALTVQRPLDRSARAGDVIANKYRLERGLGRGGMGRVFAARHLMLDTIVALKFMHPHLASDPHSVGRFEREARVAATLRSPHAARIIDVDQLPSGELYIVMEYLEGVSLDSIANDGLPVADAISYVVQACDAIAEAHDRGILHRDVKPANLFLAKGKSCEQIKVLDFGLAKAADPTGNVPSGTMNALGTPHFMSPEQINNAPDIDGRTDVWSIGATLYQLLTGRPAFDGASPADTFMSILHEGYAPIRASRPDVPVSLENIVERCLAKAPSARFRTVRDLARALEAARTALSAAPFAISNVGPRTGPTFRPTASSVRPPLEATNPSLLDASPMATQTSGRNLLLAALAGPALIALTATVMAIVASLTPREPTTFGSTPASATLITAKTASPAPRRKLPTLSPRCARNPRAPGCAMPARP